ncbi:hypothetical protein FQN60_011470 [Etheostoma spectabile]|uniref:Uncharacterized protein n=1 Tax=Etheostoma spectabile TaxID=54343 RepID=A0A5J5C931_9PERO|nr:hypothetical protein FQN60_011470 [Etheostoma spectabile]
MDGGSRDPPGQVRNALPGACRRTQLALDQVVARLSR